MSSLVQSNMKTVDRKLLMLSLGIPLLGLLLLYSAGYNPDYAPRMLEWLAFVPKSEAFVRQGIFLGVGVLLAVAVALIHPRTWYRHAWTLYAVTVILLLAVNILGLQAQGAQRWISLGGFRFQPSELAKVTIILVMARYLSLHPPRSGAYSLRELIIPVLIIGLPMALILKQPDLGTALAVGSIGFGLVLIVGVRLKTLALLALVAVIAGFGAWNHLHEYQKRRVRVLFDPAADPRAEAWHITQSKIAVGSGELFGKGFMQGTQTQLEFLPERTTDFVFCVLAEEWGFLGSVLILLLFFFLLLRIIRIGREAKLLFASFLCIGVAVSILFHVFINVGMVIGVVPVVGLPLPFLSYGGSSLLSNCFALGLVFGVRARTGVFSEVLASTEGSRGQGWG